MTAQLIRGLAAIVGEGHVLVDADVRRSYEVDWTGRFIGSSPCVVRPGSSDEVAAVIALCRVAGTAIVAQGGNTGLVGGGVPLGGEVVVSLRRLDWIGEVDELAGQISVGAGATLAAVQDAAAAHGWRYAVDFGARGSATIGGTIATNAGGINVLRYGGTREQVVGIEAVLGSGYRVRRMTGLVKDNTGFHLPSILCGSEGTLGLVTAAVLRLVPAPEHRVTALVGFATIHDLVAAVGVVRGACDRLDAAEIMLRDGMELVRDCFGATIALPRPWPAALLLEASGTADVVDALAGALESAPAVGDVVVADTSVRRAELWRLRDEHTAAINTLGVPHKFDVTVPRSRLADVMAEIPSVVGAVAPHARTWQFGHVGDGNIHINVTGGAGDGLDDMLDETVYRWVCGQGGCISAEHGIGTAKARWLHLDRSTDEIAAMRALRGAWDPDGILNPAVLVPLG